MDDSNSRLRLRLRNYGEFTLIFRDEFEAKRIQERYEINGITGPGVTVKMYDSTVCRVTTSTFRERCALRIEVEDTSNEAALPKLERLLKASIAPVGRTYAFMHRLAYGFELCDFTFMHCDAQCTDCVACRSEYEVDACKGQKA